MNEGNNIILTANKKNPNIEILRLISIFAVIMIHVAAGAVSNFAGESESFAVEALKTVHILLKWSVPVFLTISGYCILGKKESCDYKWVMPHVGRFAAALFVFGFGYAFIERFFIAKSFSFKMITGSFADILNGNLWDHMWYVYCIIGIYLVMPILHSFVSAKKENVIWLAGLCFLFEMIVPMINRFTGLSIDFFFPFSKHLLYVCLGALFAKYPLKNDIKYDVMLLVVLILAAFTAVFDKGDKAGYYSLWICLMAASIFVLIIRRNIKVSYEKVRNLSKLTWGVYLIHPLFLNVIYKLLKFNPITHLPALSVIIVWAVVTIISFAVVFVLRKIPIVSKML